MDMREEIDVRHDLWALSRKRLISPRRPIPERFPHDPFDEARLTHMENTNVEAKENKKNMTNLTDSHVLHQKNILFNGERLKRGMYRSRQTLDKTYTRSYMKCLGFLSFGMGTF